jgi:hypothetical protein
MVKVCKWGLTKSLLFVERRGNMDYYIGMISDRKVCLFRIVFHDLN